MHYICRLKKVKGAQKIVGKCRHVLLIEVARVHNFLYSLQIILYVLHDNEHMFELLVLFVFTWWRYDIIYFRRVQVLFAILQSSQYRDLPVYFLALVNILKYIFDKLYGT